MGVLTRIGGEEDINSSYTFAAPEAIVAGGKTGVPGLVNARTDFADMVQLDTEI